MAKDFQLSVVAPDRSVVEERVASIVAPGTEGYFGVMAGHEPMIASMKAGVLEYSDDRGDKSYVAVGGGFVEVLPERVTVLADNAALAPEIDIAKEEHALEEARKALRGEASTMTSEEATQEIERAVNRLRAARMK